MEPTLKDIEDYNTLKGEKKRVVWAVVISGLILGGIYVLVSSFYSKPNDALEVSAKTRANIPLQ